MKEITINVSYFPDDGTWLAECDEIGLVTESRNYGALVSRALEILPELAIENGFTQKNEKLVASFVQKHSLLIVT